MDRLKYLITGSTGLIGSALVKRLSQGDAEITCPVRNKEKAKTIFNDAIYRNIKWIEGALEQSIHELADDYDYIVHCASPTSSRFFVEHPVETMLFNNTTTTLLLDYATKHRIKGMVYLSSLESYGTVLEDKDALHEEFQGYVNPMETRSSYNMAKRMCESLCHAYAEEYHVPVKVVRLTQTISPDITVEDMRVFAQFARLAARGEDIVLHTEGESARQYIHIEDAVDAILCVLYNGKCGEAYNAAREDSYISAREMAEFVQTHFNPSGKVVIQKRNDMGYAPTTKIRLDTRKLQALGWNAKYSLYEMYRDLITNLTK